MYDECDEVEEFRKEKEIKVCFRKSVCLPHFFFLTSNRSRSKAEMYLDPLPGSMKSDFLNILCPRFGRKVFFPLLPFSVRHGQWRSLVEMSLPLLRLEGVKRFHSLSLLCYTLMRKPRPS